MGTLAGQVCDFTALAGGALEDAFEGALGQFAEEVGWVEVDDGGYADGWDNKK